MLLVPSASVGVTHTQNGERKLGVKAKNSVVRGTSPFIQTDNLYLLLFNNHKTSGINNHNWNWSLEDSSYFSRGDIVAQLSKKIMGTHNQSSFL